MIAIAPRADGGGGRYTRRVVRVVLLASLALAIGCGRIGYDAVADAGLDGDSDGPLAACTAACAPCAPRPLGDDFDDGALGDGWGPVLSNGSTFAEGGGVVTLTAAVEGEAWIETVLAYDVGAQPAIVHLIGIDAAPPRADVCLAIRDDAFTFASICVGAGGAELRFDAPGVVAQTQPFVAATMSWWRLTRTGAALRFATSPDGVTWGADAVITGTPALTGPAYVRVGVSNFSAPPGPAVARFDTARVGGPPDNLRGLAIGCAPAGWGDDFEDGVSPAWTIHAEPGAVAVEAGGAARLAPPLAAGQGGAAGFAGLAAFDLRGGTAAVALASSLTGGDATVEIELRHLGGGDGVAYYLRPPTLSAATLVAFQPTLIGGVPYDPVAHRHLRFRHAGATLLWEASPDGATWAVVHSAADVIDPRAVELSFGVAKYNGAATGDSRFEAVTLGP